MGGFPEHLVQLAIEVQLLDHGINFTRAVDLFAATEAICQSPEAQAQIAMKLHLAEESKRSSTPRPTRKEALRRKVQTMARENQLLKRRKMCRSCRTVELAISAITFLPCGHVITCEACSEMFDNCPACGKPIMGTVRTFLS